MTATNTIKTIDNIKMREHNYDVVFKEIGSGISKIFNTAFAKGWALSNLDPQIGMITGIIKNSTLTPYVMDGFLYGGFSMQADLPTL